MRILFLTRYSPQAASSRYRYYQFSDALTKCGHECEFAPLLPDEYLQHLYERRRLPLLPIALGYLRRFYDVMRSRQFDVVVLQYEVFPWMPVLLERLLFCFNKKVVLDLDDAWYEIYARNRFLGGKIPWLMAHSRFVVAGSKVLADFSKQHTDQVFEIPTVVDVARYNPKSSSSPGHASEVVWIGSPVTAKLLLPYREVWQTICNLYPNVSFKFIGAGDHLDLPGVRYRVVRWSESTEAKELVAADIGIMPLQDDDFQRGKCALKIIQYMAAGLPVVASAIGANIDVVQKDKTGFLPASEEEWVESLATLIENGELRDKMGKCGRIRAEQLYSVDRTARILESVFTLAAQPDSKSYRLEFQPGKVHDPQSDE